MSAPESKTIRSLDGNWTVNRSLSDDLTSTFTMQGLSWITRKVLTSGGIGLALTQGTEEVDGQTVPRLHQEQTVTPGNFKSEDIYLLDGVDRDQVTQAFGALLTKVGYATVEDVKDEDLKKSLTDSGETEVISEFSSSKKNGWSTLTIWALENVNGEKRLTQTSYTEKKGKSVKARLVYDFVQ